MMEDVPNLGKHLFEVTSVLIVGRPRQFLIKLIYWYVHKFYNKPTLVYISCTKSSNIVKSSGHFHFNRVGCVKCVSAGCSSELLQLKTFHNFTVL